MLLNNNDLEKLEDYEFGPVDFQLDGDDGGGDLTRDDILSGLNDDDSDSEDSDEEESDDKKESKDDKEEDKGEEGEEEKIDIEDEEGEEEENEEEDDDVQDLLAPLSRKAVLKKYPNIFKDFPQLEKGYYGNLEYRRAFPTVKEAQAAAQKMEEFSAIENELRQGNSESLLKNIKGESEENFAKIVDNYLPTLQKIDEKAYFHVIGNTVKRLVFAMASSSKEKNDEDLLTAAKIVKGYIFGEAPIDGITNFSKEESKESKELDDKRKKFDAERLGARKNEVTDRVDRMVRTTLNKHIDPRESMSEYVKKNAVREAKEMVDDLLGKDKEFQGYIDRMWQSAAKQDFSEDSTSRIRNAYISKAKTLLPQVIRKIRTEALKESGREKSRSDRGKEKTFKITGSKSAANKGGKDEGKRNDGKGMSTLEFLSSD